MSWYLHDDKGYVGDLATSVGLEQLRKTAGTSLRAFLDAGEATEKDLPGLIAETSGNKSTEYLSALLKKCRGAALITDGVVDDDSDNLENIDSDLDEIESRLRAMEEQS